MKVLLVIVSLVFFGLTSWANVDSKAETDDSVAEGSTRNSESCGDSVKCGMAHRHAHADPQGQSRSGEFAKSLSDSAK